MTTAEALQWAEETLATSSTTARLDSLVLLGHALALSKAELLAHPERNLSSKEVATFKELCALRCSHTPLSYITHKQEFFGRSFFVDERVLIPRPETEMLVQSALDTAPQNCSVLEVGTGSGCIAITLALERNDLQITASDISPDALAVATQNADSFEASLNLIESDLLADIEETFDVVVANLPYVPSALRDKPDLASEPPGALFAGGDGLDCYRDFIPQALRQLKTGGTLIIEHLPQQFDEITHIANSANAKADTVDEFVTRIRKDR